MERAAPPRWSVVIPAYNEAERLPTYLQEVATYLEGRGESYEIVVVDDGSVDGTRERVLALAAAHPGIVLQPLSVNRGKGYAVRTGMARARGTFRLKADADGATPIVELKRLEAAVHAGADLAVGSRALADPSVTVRARAHRRHAGRLFHLITRGIGVRSVVDTQCGFKLLRGPVADNLFPDLATDGFGFDVELLLLAERRGYRIAEVPVNWTDQPGSKVAILKDGPRMLGQILAARARVATARSSRRHT